MSRRRMQFLGAAAAISLVAFSLFWVQQNREYHADTLAVRARKISDDYVEVTCETPAESLYWCTGVSIEKTDKTFEITLKRGNSSSSGLSRCVIVMTNQEFAHASIGSHQLRDLCSVSESTDRTTMGQ